MSQPRLANGQFTTHRRDLPVYGSPDTAHATHGSDTVQNQGQNELQSNQQYEPFRPWRAQGSEENLSSAQGGEQSTVCGPQQGAGAPSIPVENSGGKQEAHVHIKQEHVHHPGMTTDEEMHRSLIERMHRMTEDLTKYMSYARAAQQALNWYTSELGISVKTEDKSLTHEMLSELQRQASDDR